MWNRILTLGFKQPILVISAAERQKGQPYSEIASAATDLANMGLRVVIDSSEGALTDESRTLTECYIEVEPMSLETVNQMPELTNLLKFLRNEKLYDEVSGCKTSIQSN